MIKKDEMMFNLDKKIHNTVFTYSSPSGIKSINLDTVKKERVDVIVAGAGPAGVCAAIASARKGAKTVLIEAQGQLGGIWTTGQLPWIIDFTNKNGLLKEITGRIQTEGGAATTSSGKMTGAFDPEVIKYVLEEMCREAGVSFFFTERVCGASVEKEEIAALLTQSKEGFLERSAEIFIDATGDGDLGAAAGCTYAQGDESGNLMPSSMLGILSGIEATEIAEFINGEGLPWGVPHKALLETIRRGGHNPSYSYPALFRINDRSFAILANHQYGTNPFETASLTKAVLEGRKELFQITRALRANGGVWKNIFLAATSTYPGVREARRLKGIYTLNVKDLEAGAIFHDGVVHAENCVDIHPPKKGVGDLTTGGIKTKPYDIPLRSLLSAERNNLLFAGRCISGDYYSHASYRVTGNAAATGEAAGKCAALSTLKNKKPQEIQVEDMK